MKGKMGYCPDWYAIIQAAKYLGVPPWELIEHSRWWTDRAFDGITAENEAREILELQNRKR